MQKGRNSLVLAASCLGIITAFIGLAPTAAADGGLRNAWQNRYPGSGSYDNASCALCHASSSQTSRYNTYGYAIKLQKDMGLSDSAAIAAVENFDSDSDPTGSSNLVEVNSDTQPGWTDGPNNTTYTGGGTPTTGVTAPSSITGDLDPMPAGLGTSYCGPAVANSSGMPAVITADGSDVVADNDVTLTASQLPAGQFGYFLVSRSQGFFSPPGSQGNICLSADIGRYNAPPTVPTGELIVGPTGSLVIDLTDLPTNTPGSQMVMAGETLNFQCWYRDNNPSVTSNFTDGRSIVFQ